jgi:transposase
MQRYEEHGTTSIICPVCKAVYAPTGFSDGEIFTCDHCLANIRLTIAQLDTPRYLYKTVAL